MPAGYISARGGTLFQSVLPAAVTSATYNLANRLTTRTAAGVTASPTWDDNGNLTSDGVRTHSWDARNRLTAIPGAASFAYDAFGRRQTATRGGTTTSFLYDGWDVVQEQQGGNPSADLVLGLGADERFVRNGATLLSDPLGSTVALASGGAVQTSYGYDPYGVAQVTGTASDNPFQYTGRESDGTGLLNYRNRYYNPAWGRFVSEDPIGLNGGINVYAYADGNPVNFNDPSGTRPTPSELKGPVGGCEAIVCMAAEPAGPKRPKEGYNPAPFIPDDPYSPESGSRRTSDTKRQEGAPNNDPDDPYIPDRGPGRDMGGHDARGQTPHDTGERNVNPNEEHSRRPKGGFRR